MLAIYNYKTGKYELLSTERMVFLLPYYWSQHIAGPVFLHLN